MDDPANRIIVALTPGGHRLIDQASLDDYLARKAEEHARRRRERLEARQRKEAPDAA